MLNEARHVLDRTVGYKISPLFWDKFAAVCPPEQVQTVAMRVIVERERGVKAFIKQEYWTLDANLAAKKTPYFVRGCSVKEDQPEIPNQAESDRWSRISRARNTSSNQWGRRRSAATR